MIYNMTIFQQLSHQRKRNEHVIEFISMFHTFKKAQINVF